LYKFAKEEKQHYRKLSIKKSMINFEKSNHHYKC
jgi:hypothetical protein